MQSEVPAAAEMNNAAFRPQRTIIIGLGGTGADVLLRVRRLIVERFGGLDKLPIARFLTIDTDQGWTKQMTNHDAAMVPFQESEQALISLENTRALFENIRQGRYPNYRWFSFNQLQNTPSVVDGAGTVRQLGRLCFFGHYQTVRQKLTNIIQDLRQNQYDQQMAQIGLNLQPGISIYVVSSIAGGTGSGIYLDMAYLARQLLIELQIEGGETIGCLVLPSAFAGLTSSDSIATNGYAALKELNYYTYRGTTEGQLQELYQGNRWDVQYVPGDVNSRIQSNDMPFDVCYLLGTSNGNTTIGRSELFEMIARNIFFEFAHEFSAFKRSLRANVLQKIQGGGQDTTDSPTRYLSFGQSAVMFPNDRVRRVLALALARGALNHLTAIKAPIPWVARDAASALPPAIESLAGSEDVQKEMRAFLTREFIPNQGLDLEKLVLAVQQPANGPGLPDQAAELRSGRVHQVGEEKWPRDRYPTLNRVFDEWKALYDDTAPDPVQWGEHIRQIEAYRQAALRRLKQVIARTVSDLMVSPAKGTSHAVAFLDLLVLTCENRKKRLLDDLGKPAALVERLPDIYLRNYIAGQRRTDQSLSALILDRIEYEYNQLIALTTGLVLGRSEKLRAQAREYLNWCERYLRARIQERSYRSAAQMMNELQGYLNDQKQTVLRLGRALSSARARLAKEQEAMDQQARTTEVLGMLLYDDQHAGQLVEALVGQLQASSPDALAVGPIAERALQKTGLKSIADLDDERVQPFVQALASEASAVLAGLDEQNTGSTSFAAYDLLVALYGADPDGSGLAERLQRIETLSTPFVQLETHAPGGHISPTLAARGIGLCGGNTGGDPERERVLDALEAIGWSAQNDVRPIRDTSEIVFFQELGAFPLRALQDINTLRDRYLNFRSRPGAQPLHLEHETLALRYPDLLPPEPAVLDQVQQVVAVSLALNALPIGPFPDPTGAGGLVEQYYFTRQLPLGEVDKLPLGATRGNITMKLLGDPALTDEMKAALEQLVEQTPQDERVALTQRLKDWLEQFADDLALQIGELDPKQQPLYKAERDRLLDFQREAGLPDLATSTA